MSVLVTANRHFPLETGIPFHHVSSTPLLYVSARAIYVYDACWMGSIAQNSLSRRSNEADETSEGPIVLRRDFAYERRPHSIRAESLDQRKTPLEMAKKALDFAELLSGPTITVTVGPRQQPWTLHLGLLQQHSPHLKKTNTDTKTLDLPGDDPRGFALLVKWLYQGNLDDVSLIRDAQQKYDHAVALHRLHLLAHSFGMIELTTLAYKDYRRCLHQTQLVPDAEEANEIYKASPKSSPFRPLMAQIAARQTMDPSIKKDASYYRQCFEGDPEFAIAMVNAIRNMSGGLLLDDPTGDSEESGTPVKRSPTVDGASPIAANQARARAVSSAVQSAQPTPLRVNASPRPSAPNNTPHSNKRRELHARSGSHPPVHVSRPNEPKTVAPPPPVRSIPRSPRTAINGVNGIVNKLENMSRTSTTGRTSLAPTSDAGRSTKRNPPRKLRRESTSTAG